MPSTVIRRIHYEADSRLLIVEFLSRRRYAYFDVPQDVYAALRAAHSRGSYFNRQIRDRYSFARLDHQDAMVLSPAAGAAPPASGAPAYRADDPAADAAAPRAAA